MDILNKLQELLNSILDKLGLAVQIPGLVLGLVLLGIAASLFYRVSGPNKSNYGIGTRILAGFLATVGVPITLTALRVGSSDALLWSLITLAVAGFWVAGAKGKLITLLGIVVGILAIAAVIRISDSAPSGAFVASSVKAITDQIGVTWSGIITHKH